MKFDAPIAGASLTREPGNSPWEQPPLYATQEEALNFYFRKFDDEEFIDDTMFLLERKMPLETFVDSMTSAGVMEGYHTFDVKQLISPQIHEYLKTLAETLEIDFIEEEGPSKEERMKAKDKTRMKLLIEEALNTDLPDEKGGEEPVMPPEEMPVAPPTPATPPPAKGGLIPRRV